MKPLRGPHKYGKKPSLSPARLEVRSVPPDTRKPQTTVRKTYGLGPVVKAEPIPKIKTVRKQGCSTCGHPR